MTKLLPSAMPERGYCRGGRGELALSMRCEDVFLKKAVMRYYLSEGIAAAALTEADLKHSVG